MTFQGARKQAERELARAGIPEPETDAHLLLEDACGISMTEYYICMNEEMPSGQLEKYRDLIRKRCSRIPLQRLTGEQEFMGLTFAVRPDVLIPRQDTEILAEEAIRHLENLSGDGKGGQPETMPGREPKILRVLDLCTGSGCLAVSIKHFCPEVRMTASDCSQAALEAAERNAERNGADVEFLQSDLFDKIEGSFDLIVCNPPYIASGEIPSLMPEVSRFEPRLALDGGEDGLWFYRKIAEQSPDHLNPRGCLFFEIGSGQAEKVASIMRKNGFQEICITRDLAGLDRVAAGKISAERRCLEYV